MKKLRLYLPIFIYWILLANLLCVFLITSIRFFLDASHVNTSDLGAVAKGLISAHQLVDSSLFGAFFGLLFIGVNELAIKLELEKRSFGRIILLKSLLYLLGFIASIILVFMLSTLTNTFPVNAIESISSSNSLFILIFFIFIFVGFQIFLLNFLLQVITKFGKSNLKKFITGKYQHPVIEKRVFLFMDLKSSTTYAESLGNILYSSLIKDCITLVNEIVDKYGAEIYQYVGDEIVLTWDYDKVKDKSCFVDLYFAFQNELNNRSAYYMKKYMMVPVFKAGLHGGDVTVAEIGNIKRDIAFHGDAVNTAARLQSACNDYGAHFLTSGNMLTEFVKVKQKYPVKYLGGVVLKGKRNYIDVYEVQKHSA